MVSSDSGPGARLSGLTQLVTEVACNPEFARWLFDSPAAALEAVRRSPSAVLGPGLPGREFDVPAIPLSDAECCAVVGFGARTVPQLAQAVRLWTSQPGPVASRQNATFATAC
jgi:hypothetical protein